MWLDSRTGAHAHARVARRRPPQPGARQGQGPPAAGRDRRHPRGARERGAGAVRQSPSTWTCTWSLRARGAAWTSRRPRPRGATRLFRKFADLFQAHSIAQQEGLSGRRSRRRHEAHGRGRPLLSGCRTHEGSGPGAAPPVHIPHIVPGSTSCGASGLTRRRSRPSSASQGSQAPSAQEQSPRRMSSLGIVSGSHHPPCTRELAGQGPPASRPAARSGEGGGAAALYFIGRWAGLRTARMAPINQCQRRRRRARRKQACATAR